MPETTPPDKSALLSALREALHTQLHALSTMIGASRDEATSEQSRPENKYDTRALEASYLAAGQGQRLADLKQLVGWVDSVSETPAERVRPGSFARVDDGERTYWLFLAPQGGHSIPTSEGPVQLLGTASPLGRALLGAEAGESCAYEAPSGERELEVVQVL